MADVKTTEEIGLELEKRKQEKQQTSPGLSELPVIEAKTEWDNTGFRERIHEILATAEYLRPDLSLIVMPEKGFAKFQYRRKRENFDDLVQSIKERGVLEDITLQWIAGEDGVSRYYVIDGHTRLVALKKAIEEDSSTPIPVFRVLEVSDADAAQVAVELNMFAENFDDEDLQALVIRLYEEASLMQKDIAEQLGVTPSYVSMIIGAFQDVPPEARDRIERRVWTVKHGRALARLKNDSEEQERIFKNAVKHRYAAAKMDDMVSKSLAREKFKKLAKEQLKPELDQRTKKTLTTKQLEKIHKTAVDGVAKDNYSYTSGYGDTAKKLIQLGGTSIEPAVSHTREVVEDLGFEIVPSVEVDEPIEEPKPVMPEDSVLMDEHYLGSLCPYCKGRTHRVVAESLDFETNVGYTGTKRGLAHEYCDIKARIESLQKDLAADSIYKKMQKNPEYLKHINGKGHALYKEELERRKQKWREENIPPETVIQKGSKVGEPAPAKKSKDRAQLLEKVRKKNPKLVASKYFDAYEKHLQQEAGYELQKDVAEKLGIAAQSVQRPFSKIAKAIAKLE